MTPSIDLSTSAIRQYWLNQSPELAALFDEIETRETWVADHDPYIEQRLMSFGKMLSENDPSRLLQAGTDDLLFFLVYITTSRSMRILEWLDLEYPEVSGQLHALLLSDNGSGVYVNVTNQVLAKTLVQRLSVARNTLYFRQILSPRVIGIITSALEQMATSEEDDL